MSLLILNIFSTNQTFWTTFLSGALRFMCFSFEKICQASAQFQLGIKFFLNIILILIYGMFQSQAKFQLEYVQFLFSVLMLNFD